MESKKHAKELNKKLEKMFNDKETCIKIQQILNLRQEERWFEEARSDAESHARHLHMELDIKYKLRMLELSLLIAHFEKGEKFEEFIKEHRKGAKYIKRHKERTK